jgi:high-affinity nickel permease
MKTIKAFLIGIFTLVLSVVSLVSACAVAIDSTTLYYKANQIEPTTFTTMFVVISIILFAIGLQLLILSVGAFKLFSKYHDMYLENKRDRQIKNQFTNETYQQLYKDLAEAPNLEIKEAILNTFYDNGITMDKPKDFADLMEILSRK